MYIYTEWKFAPLPLLDSPVEDAPHSQWNTNAWLFVHKVNTPFRAKRKENKYPGYELDLLADKDGTVWVAHDEEEIKNGVQLQDILGALKRPQEKSYWLDLKTELTEAQLNEIIATAAQYQVSPEQLLFETAPGPTAKLIKQKNLALLLQLLDGFDEDHNDAKKREVLNARAVQEWQAYHPAAVSASFGKYAYLRAYFPNMPKAIYYSATRRPSLKKTFMRQYIAQDPSVRIFMLDEYSL